MPILSEVGSEKIRKRTEVKNVTYRKSYGNPKSTRKYYVIRTQNKRSSGPVGGEGGSVRRDGQASEVQISALSTPIELRNGLSFSKFKLISLNFKDLTHLKVNRLKRPN